VGVNFGATVPSLSLIGVNVVNPPKYDWNFNSVQYYHQYTVGDETAGKADVKYELVGLPIADLRAGLRIAERSQTSDAVDYSSNGLYSNGYNYPSSYFSTTTYGNLFSGVGGFPSYWQIPNPDLPGNPQGLFNDFDLGSVPGFDPIMHFQANEQSYAGYAMADFLTSALGLKMDGNIGLRLVDTEQQLTGSIDSTDNHYLTPLPSANLRIFLQDNLYLRLAASRVFALPTFQDLNPSVIVNKVQDTAYKGNPDLKPLEATQFDASLEYYFNKSGVIHGAAFYKDITNYVEYTSAPGVYAGTPYYQVTHPINTPGTVKGLEAGYQQFFDFLPHPLNGLGLQANYTYLDSYAANVNPLLDAPLTALSRHSVNVIGMYEDDRFSLRLAFNWRSAFVDGFVDAQSANAARVQYENGYGTLDASAGYHITPHLTAFVEGGNLTHPLRKVFYSDGTNAGSIRQDETVIFGIRFKN
jgi:TonB-dependent receptor